MAKSILTRLAATALAIIALTAAADHAAAQKGNYDLVAEFQPPHIDNNSDTKNRKYQLNALKLSDSGRFLIADYGYKNSMIALYSIDSLDFMCGFWIDGVAELENCYFSDDEKRLYVKASRFTADYKVIDIATRKIRDISCDRTPRGCVSQPAGLNVVKFYSPDRQYYFVRNANDRKTLHIYRRAD